MKNILIIDLAYVWGGQQKHIQDLSQYYVNNNYNVTLIAENKKFNSIEKIIFHKVSPAYKNFYKLKKYIQTLCFQHKYDYVIFNGSRATYFSLILKKNITTYWFSIIHHTSAQANYPVLAQILFNMSHNKIDKIISVSKSVNNTLNNSNKKKSLIISNGVPKCNGKRIITNKIVVSFIGRLVKHKGIIDFLHMANSIVVEYNNIEFCIAGDGELREYVIEKSSDNVHYLGNLENPCKLYQKTDILVLPSQFEGMPLSLLEGMSASCALIGYNSPGIVDVIQDNYNGFLVEKNYEELIKAIKRYLENRDLLLQCQKNAYKEFSTLYTQDKMFLQYKKALEK